MSAVHFCAVACIKVLLVQIGWHQSTSVQFTLFIKKWISEFALLYDPRVAHNLQTGLQLDVTRRSSRPIHTDALDLVSAGILCPVLLEHVERSVFITEAGRRVAPGHDGATRCGFATWTDIQLRRAVRSRDGSC